MNLEKKLKECEELRDKYLTNWKRETADFLNYKKGEEERIGEILKYSNEMMILNILPILDNLYIAESHITKDLKNNESVKGLLLIKNQILDFLKSIGVEEIQSLKQEFNPEFHEAVEIEESNSESNIIIKELNKGYIYQGKVIRPAKVKITK